MIYVQRSIYDTDTDKKYKAGDSCTVTMKSGNRFVCEIEGFIDEDEIEIVVNEANEDHEISIFIKDILSIKQHENCNLKGEK